MISAVDAFVRSDRCVLISDIVQHTGISEIQCTESPTSILLSLFVFFLTWEL